MTRKKSISEAPKPMDSSTDVAPIGESAQTGPVPGPVSEGSRSVAPPPGDHQYPMTDVLRNHGTFEFACRRTGLLLPPGASQRVTIRDGDHLAQLLGAIDQFSRALPQAGLLKFDRLHG